MTSVEPSSRQRSRLLLVEDDGELRATLCDVLTEVGQDVWPCSDAKEALAAIEQRDFDAVLTDVHMPGMDGIALCRQLSGDRPSLPVIVMTAFGDVDAAVGAMRAGAFDFVTKPLTIDDLAVIFRRVLERQGQGPTLMRLDEPTP